MATDNKLHIVMFPWLAFGHILPYLKLAKLIAKKGHKISFISTTKNIDSLPKIPSTLAHNIDLVKFTLPPTPNLPQDAEATIDVPFHEVKFLKIAYDKLQNQISNFLEVNSPDWILFDLIPYWIGPIAAKFGVRSCLFSIFSAATMVFIAPQEVMRSDGDDSLTPESFTGKPKWVPFKTSVGITLYQIRRLFVNFEADETENVTDLVRIAGALRDCDLVAIRSCDEFEGKWLELLPEVLRKPVIQVGLLPADDTGDDKGKSDDFWVGIKDWIDKQEKRSVIYVAFGAETKPNQDELTELALGLELSGAPFMWAIRKQRGSADPDPIELPDGFVERTRGRGLVYTSWVPQTKIVSHDSVGALLIHCGWSSVIEAVQFGKALVLLPFLADQGIIGSFVEEMKLGYLIPRNEEDGWFRREDVAASVRLVMVEEEGKMYRENVEKMKHVVGDMSKQDEYVDNLLTYLKENL